MDAACCDDVGVKRGKGGVSGFLLLESTFRLNLCSTSVCIYVACSAVPVRFPVSGRVRVTLTLGARYGGPCELHFAFAVAFAVSCVPWVDCECVEGCIYVQSCTSLRPFVAW